MNTDKERQRVKFYTDNATSLPILAPSTFGKNHEQNKNTAVFKGANNNSNDILKSVMKEESSSSDDEMWFANGTTNRTSGVSNGMVRAIDRADFQTKRDPVNATALLDRQFAPVLYTTDYDKGSDLRKPETCYIAGENAPCTRNNNSCTKGTGNCGPNGLLQNDKVCRIGKRDYKINLNGVLEADKITADKIHSVKGQPTIGSTTNPSVQDVLKNKNDLDDETGILISNIDPETREKYMMNCSQRRRNLDWSHYRAPPKQINGQGFGNPNNYHQTRYGLDSRHDCNGPIRDTDFEDREMVPLNTMLWNYGGVRYDDDIRLGAPTRTYKKTTTQWKSGEKGSYHGIVTEHNNTAGNPLAKGPVRVPEKFNSN